MKILGYDHETREMSAPESLDDCRIDMFYDRSLRLWTLMLKDSCNNQVSHCMYANTRKEANEIQKSDFEVYY